MHEVQIYTMASGIQLILLLLILNIYSPHACIQSENYTANTELDNNSLDDIYDKCTSYQFCEFCCLDRQLDDHIQTNSITIPDHTTTWLNRNLPQNKAIEVILNHINCRKEGVNGYACEDE